ncbi:hypothetical protein AGMMS49959_04800 [Planctomycetales bacterium]|nr:hypothetical protein AGMMS49959_04800 [Planctomycetales bacterium]
MRYFWLIAALTAALDLGSKHAVFAWLATRGVFDLIPGYLSFTRHINEGALWGLGSGAPLALLLLTAAMMAVVTWLAWSHRRKPAPLWALGLILGGAVGNFFTQSANGRAAAPEFLRAEAVRLFPARVDRFRAGFTPVTATLAAQVLAGERGLVCVAGSFYLIGELRMMLIAEKFGTPAGRELTALHDEVRRAVE